MILQKKLESENFQRIICEKKLERQKILKEKFSRGKNDKNVDNCLLQMLFDKL